MQSQAGGRWKRFVKSYVLSLGWKSEGAMVNEIDENENDEMTPRGRDEDASGCEDIQCCDAAE